MSLTRKVIPKTQRVLYLLLLVLCGGLVLLGIGSAILSAYFSVPLGDDYIALTQFHSSQSWIHESVYSLTHTGRYTQSILSSIFYGLLGRHGEMFLPLVSITWMTALLYLGIIKLCEYYKITASKLAIVAGSLTLLFLIIFAGRPVMGDGTIYMFQPFFFTSAIVTYTLPLLALSSFAYYLLLTDRKKRRSDIYILSLLIYVLSLTNEVMPASIVMISGAAISLSYLPRPYTKWLKDNRRWFFCALIAASFALLTMYLSPSNVSRRDSVGFGTKLPLIPEWTASSLNVALQHIIRPVDLLFIACLALLVSFTLKLEKVHITKKVPLTAIGWVLLGISLLSFIPSLILPVIGYSFAGILPRTMLIPQIFYILGTASIFVALSEWLTTKLRLNPLAYAGFIALSCIAVLVPIPHMAKRVADNAAAVARYSAIWHTQDDALKEAAAKSPTTTYYAPESAAGIGDGYSTRCTGPYVSTTTWLPDGMEQYYGVKRICSTLDSTGQ